MSRSAPLVAAALVAIGLVAWFAVDRPAGPPDRPPAATARQPVTAAPPAAPPGAPAAAPVPQPAPAGVPRIATAEDFARVLKSRGLDGDKLVAAYRDWRLSRGYLDADPLTGLTGGLEPAAIYAGMDRESLKALADGGDLGAIQAFAAASVAVEPAMAVEYYGRATRQGSAAAMVELAGALAASASPATSARNPRRQAAAWLLAAIRLHGPVVATPAVLADLDAFAGDPDPAFLPSACATSLAILADLSATPAGQEAGTLPPAFLAEQSLYDRLPCRDTPAPVTPPRALAGCTATAALAAGDRPAELWVCPEA